MPDHDLEDDATIKGKRYSGVSLAGRSAEAVDIEQCEFDGVRFTGMNLVRSVLAHNKFNTCDFASVRTQDVSLIRTTVTGCRLTGSTWSNGSFRDVTFEGTRTENALFRYAKFRTVLFRECNLSGADFQFAEFRDVRFEKCDLTGAQVANLVVQPGVSFDGCTLLDVGGATYLKGATVRGPGGMELALSLAREAGIKFED
ncbi:pentapeptide repeat-containing protein [Kitasatospora purpeofusca]|uniref:pentapeptide repeat-containing protein n=1 Tax=Kitasatospora purpeofusca TaxID=67352 RepID=UPI002256C89B|nr:pentapeptide repeat-containing protein [Kitasatospora purpeofusca]MCX4685483.1 pentapeptide repeat-containing protein [Kitasatospora purpeofusca]